MEFSGPGVAPLDRRGHGTVARESQARLLGIPRGQLGAYVLVPDCRFAVDVHLAREVEDLPEANAAAPAADRRAFVHQRGDGDLPALPDGT